MNSGFVVKVKIVFSHLTLAHFTNISLHLRELLLFSRPGKIYSKIYNKKAQDYLRT